MRWTYYSALEHFDRFRTLWDRINKIYGQSILLDSIFVSSLVRNFASEKTLLAICDASQQPAAALLTQRRTGFWETFQPSQAPIGLATFGRTDVEHLREQMLSLMRSLPGHALGISVLQQDPDFAPWDGLNGSLSAQKLDYIDTARLILPKSWEEYWGNRSKNLTHNLTRQRRRLAEKGSVLELRAEKDPAAVASAIEAYGHLEGSGWKSKEGTAVSAGNPQGLFYREIMEDFCARSEGIIFSLLLDGKIVASDLCLTRDRKVVILKTAYDESVEGLSLGLLLHEGIFKALCNETQTEIVEFYGRVRDWHKKWTTDVRTMYHINFYRYAWIPKANHFGKMMYEKRWLGWKN